MPGSGRKARIIKQYVAGTLSYVTAICALRRVRPVVVTILVDSTKVVVYRWCQSLQFIYIRRVTGNGSGHCKSSTPVGCVRKNGQDFLVRVVCVIDGVSVLYNLCAHIITFRFMFVFIRVDMATLLQGLCHVKCSLSACYFSKVGRQSVDVYFFGIHLNRLSTVGGDTLKVYQ